MEKVVGGGYINNSVNVGSIYLDAEEQWVLSNVDVVEEDDVNLESVVMHQIDHLLGLGDSSVEGAIMYPIVLPKKKIELANDDDLQIIQQIYGVDKSNSNLVESSANHQHSMSLNIVLVLGLTSGLHVTRLL
ncbi:hypothetical protein TSUD_239640 [Trifolium subterraneum]|uniref:Peptidase M10 metallopeptidase domain-containing protein n=1 Tax=Trifolium subterraneum TaxID=3900 RepID=A0A2Z6N9S8_TRISU|nr:hypothetical protein TSUD_239640 [Trifolium subterraneum]